MPRFYSPAEHHIREADISPGALKVLHTLNQAGFRACLVGGAVRDLLLGLKPKDFDVATNATPEEVKRLFNRCRLIGRRFRLAHVRFGRELIEVATFRGDGKEGSGARQVVSGRIVRDNVWGTMEEDVWRRDFTVNALYYDIADAAAIDYVGAMDDIHQRVLRLIGAAPVRYREDPVRMLRAARLSAKLGFTLDADAEASIGTLSHLLKNTSPARLFDESMKMLMGGYATACFHRLESLDLLKALFPTLANQLVKGVSDQQRFMIEQGLANTDERIAQGRRVTPAFLLAVFLWPLVQQYAETYLANGMQPSLAWQRASRLALSEQIKYVAIPRRFTHFMEEVWTIQPRFAMPHTRKRVFRLLEHPRFRAAYDFLVLRAGEGDAIKALGQWWTRAQELSPEQLSKELTGTKSRRPRKRKKRQKNDA